MKLTIFLVGLLALSGCAALFHSHGRIPPPEGCTQCHSKPIEGNWHVLFKPAAINDEQDAGHGSVIAGGKPPADGQPRRCFTCHHTPAKNHGWYRGTYDH